MAAPALRKSPAVATKPSTSALIEIAQNHCFSGVGTGHISAAKKSLTAEDLMPGLMREGGRKPSLPYYPSFALKFS
jgi:hypothetical protein